MIENCDVFANDMILLYYAKLAYYCDIAKFIVAFLLLCFFIADDGKVFCIVVSICKTAIVYE